MAKIKLNVLLLAILFYFVSRVELSQNCAKGPEYWCESIQQAHECGAFKHCLQTVWSKHNQFLTDEAKLESSLNPNKCSNCMQCLTADFKRCPYIRGFQDEISQLLSSNIAKRPICQLLKQCDDSSSDVQVSELKNDPRFPCGIHPRNWCDTIESSKSCNAFSYCLINWSHSPALKYKEEPTDSNKVCGFCIFVFDKVQAVLQQNSTEESVRDYLVGACALLPDNDLVQACLSEVSNKFDEIYNLVRSNVDPGIICRVLKVCHDENLELKAKPDAKITDQIISGLKSIKIKIVDSAVESSSIIKSKLDSLVPILSETQGVGCELCEIVLSAAKYLLEDRVNETKVLSFIEGNLCERLGSLSTTCVDYVKADGEYILNLLILNVDPALVCHGMGLCLKVQIPVYNKNEFVNKNEKKFFDLDARSLINCTTCKTVIDNVKQKLASNESEAEVVDFINKNLCDKIGNTKEMCKNLIDQYASVIFDFISNNVSSSQLCEMIGLCRASLLITPFKSTDLISIEKSSQVGSAECVLCELVVFLADRYISKNSTQEQIEKDLELVCTKVPSSIRNQCTAFVQEYGAQIASLIAQNMNPNEICSFIGLCGGGNKVKSNHKSEVPCAVCQFVVHFLINQAKLGRAEQLIELSVNNICKFMPAKYRSECDEMMEQYGDKLVSLMKIYTDPAQICQMIKLCANENESYVKFSDLKPAKLIKNKNENDKSKNESIECSLCMYAAEVARGLIKLNKTEQEITHELQLVCNLFPANLKVQCYSFVKEYGPYVIELVSADIEPEIACHSLNLCDKTVVDKKSPRFYLDKF